MSLALLRVVVHMRNIGSILGVQIDRKKLWKVSNNLMASPLLINALISICKFSFYFCTACVKVSA